METGQLGHGALPRAIMPINIEVSVTVLNESSTPPLLRDY